MLPLDLVVLLAGWAIAQVVFNGFEAHVPWTKRIGKLVAIAAVCSALHLFIGRWLYYSVLVLMTAAIAVLHGYYFHVRHGIHWRTAEPREQYLALIGELPDDDLAKS